MDQLFSMECKALVSDSREMAINLGYNYISTVHFFLADCETGSPTSIKKFAFADDKEYLKFRAEQRLNEVNYLDHVNDSIPLTLEAESAIRLSEQERIATRSDLIYPFHILIASFKAENSILADQFRDDPKLLEKLMNYYNDLGVLEPKATTVDEKQKNPFGFLSRFFKK